MTITTLNKEESVNMAIDFLDAMLGSSLNQNAGDIEIRTFKPFPSQYFFSSISDAAKLIIDLCTQGIDVYFGINPRTGNQGTKENVHYLSAFHAEIDYGSLGHKKETEYATYEEALESINNFHFKPSIIIHSGGGFHCYWVLTNPLNVAEHGIITLENINRALTQSLKGDSGTHDISRVLRVPGTFNFKQPENPRPVEIVSMNGTTYEFEAFLEVLATLNDSPVKTKPNRQQAPVIAAPGVPLAPITNTADIDRLPVSDKIKSLIKHGNNGSYSSRSEADMAVIVSLVSKGVGDNEIRQIFQAYPIGEKYRTHASPDTRAGLAKLDSDIVVKLLYNDKERSRDHDKTHEKESRSRIQGEGGIRGAKRGADPGRISTAI